MELFTDIVRKGNVSELCDIREKIWREDSDVRHCSDPKFLRCPAARIKNAILVCKRAANHLSMSRFGLHEHVLKLPLCVRRGS